MDIKAPGFTFVNYRFVMSAIIIQPHTSQHTHPLNEKLCACMRRQDHHGNQACIRSCGFEAEGIDRLAVVLI